MSTAQIRHNALSGPAKEKAPEGALSRRGAEGGNRTRTPSREPDFESDRAYTGTAAVAAQRRGNGTATTGTAAVTAPAAVATAQIRHTKAVGPGGIRCARTCLRLTPRFRADVLAARGGR